MAGRAHFPTVFLFCFLGFIFILRWSAEKDVETPQNVMTASYSQDHILPHPNPDRAGKSWLLRALSEMRPSVISVMFEKMIFLTFFYY